MKVASIHNNTRDGQLVVVSKDLKKAVPVPHLAHTFQQAIDKWKEAEPALQKVYDALNQGTLTESVLDFEKVRKMAPIPRAYNWSDASSYVSHVELVRKSRHSEMPPSFWTDPLMYMGASDAFIGPNDDIVLASEEWGIDFESEVAVVTDDVPMGVSPKDALRHIKFLTILNDVSLRSLMPEELAKQFGFYQSKTWTSFAPTLVSVDEFKQEFRDGKLHLPLTSILNGKLIGNPNAGIDMTFDFGTLIAHATKTHPLMAGSVVGSGTISNKGGMNGSSCLVEVRALETMKDGVPSTPFMKFGDRIEIDMMDEKGVSIFGRINQVVKEYRP